MKKMTMLLLSSLFISSQAMAAREITITVPTTEEIKQGAGELWQITKEGTKKAGVITGEALQSAGQNLENYSRDKPEIEPGYQPSEQRVYTTPPTTPNEIIVVPK